MTDQYKCEHCGEVANDEYDLEIHHRGCRLKAAFPGAYTEHLDGIVAFDMSKVVNQLGLFNDWIIDNNGEPCHPLEGGLHFRIGLTFDEPTVWLEIPVRVGNSISSWSFRIPSRNWHRIVSTVDAGLRAAEAHQVKKSR